MYFLKYIFTLAKQKLFFWNSDGHLDRHSVITKLACSGNILTNSPAPRQITVSYLWTLVQVLNFFLIQRQPPRQFGVSCHTAGPWLVWYWKRKCHLRNNQFCFFIGGKRVSTPCPASCGEESHLTVCSSCQTHQALFPTPRKKPVDCSICCLQESLHCGPLIQASPWFYRKGILISSSQPA